MINTQYCNPTTLSNQFYRELFSVSDTIEPKSTVYENEKEVILEIAIPGVEKDQINIDIQKNTLTIETQIKSEKNKKDILKSQSFSQSKYKKSSRIGENLDKSNINASYKDGVLKLIFLKKEAELSKKIDIA